MKNKDTYNKIFGELRECIHGGYCTMHEITYLSQELDKINPNSIGKYYSLDTTGCSKRLWNMLCEPHLDSLDILSLNLSQEEASFLLNNWSKIKFNHDSLFYRHARDLEYIYSEQTLYNSMLNLIKISLEPYQIEEIQKFNLLDYFPLDVNEYYECAANSDSALSNEVHRIFDKLDKNIQKYCDYFHTQNIFPESILVYEPVLPEENLATPIERWIAGIFCILMFILDMYAYSKVHSQEYILTSPSSLFGGWLCSQINLNLIIEDITRNQALENAKHCICNEITKHLLNEIRIYGASSRSV